MWDKILQPPIQVTRGFVQTSLGGGKKEQGTYQIESLIPDPASQDTVSRAVVTWGPEGGFAGFRAWAGRHLQVEDKDGQPDLRVHLARNDQGQGELVVTNGEGARSTELRFPLGRLDAGADLSPLQGVSGDKVTAHFRERKNEQECGFSVGEQQFQVVDGFLTRS